MQSVFEPGIDIFFFGRKVQIDIIHSTPSFLLALVRMGELEQPEIRRKALL